MATPALNPKLKPRIYVETSVISYLTARPSRDVVNIVRQAASQALWSAGEQRFELFISELVLAEVQQGDPQAAALRLAQAQTLPLLDMLPEAADIATQLTQRGALPPTAYTDAVHIALARAAWGRRDCQLELSPHRQRLGA